MTCTFFGHRDAPETLRPVLHAVLTELIEQRGADTFYVGHQGRFDAMVRRELQALAQQYPHLRCRVVLAYMPGKRGEWDEPDAADTLYPAGLETAPRRLAIDRRNRMMVGWADTVVAYVCGPGGADKFMRLALQKGKEVINLRDRMT